MTKHIKISRSDIERFTAPALLRPTQLAHGAFVLSAAVVALMTFLSRPTSTNPAALSTVFTIGLAGIALWVVGYAVGMWVFRRRTNRSALEAALHAPFRGPKALAENATDADKIAAHLRSAWTVRTGAWEAGPILCLLAVQVAIHANLLAIYPEILTIGAIPLLAFAMLAWLTWPTRRRQLELLEKEFLSK